jgi:TRAP-type C4-dicarboxylate transport system permease small subunit
MVGEKGITMQKLTALITKALEMILIILMAVIVIDVSWQVFTRFILKNPSSYTEELAGFLLIWIGLLGASYALHTRAHLGIDVLTSKFHGVKRLISEILIYSIVLLFAFLVLVIGGWRLVNLTLTLKQISPAMGIPMGYVYIVLPLTGFLMMYYSIAAIIDVMRNPITESSDKIINPVD